MRYNKIYRIIEVKLKLYNRKIIYKLYNIIKILNKL